MMPCSDNCIGLHYSFPFSLELRGHVAHRHNSGCGFLLGPVRKQSVPALYQKKLLSTSCWLSCADWHAGDGDEIKASPLPIPVLPLSAHLLVRGNGQSTDTNHLPEM